MEEFKQGLAEKIKIIEIASRKTLESEQEFKSKFETYIKKARDILKKKNVINPKPHKKLMRAIAEDESEEEPEKNEEFAVPAPPKAKPQQQVTEAIATDRENLRPVRSAKLNARGNLKELPIQTKMRNDNNTAVVVKTERISSASSRESLKENSRPKIDNRISVDEGIQMSEGSDMQSQKDGRSMSVEYIPVKAVEIDITDDAAATIMPPPALPTKKKTRQKQTNKHQHNDIPDDPSAPIQQRITRSKIKTEKPSIDKTVSTPQISNSVLENNTIVQKTRSETVANETTNAKKGKSNKKYPLPIIVKVEKLSDDEESQKIENTEIKQKKKSSVARQKSSKANSKRSERAYDDDEQLSAMPPPPIPNITPLNEAVSISPKLAAAAAINETVTLATHNNVNETVTLATHNNANETVTLATHSNVNETVTLGKNPHDSLMTEDNDDDEDEELFAPKVPEKTKSKSSNQPPPPLPIKLKKNEVFNPYLSSPVKQKVQAFEKHSSVSISEANKAGPSSSSKYQTLKAGTPSKIGVLAFSSKTTPLSNAKQRYMSAVANSGSSSSISSASKSSAKKYTAYSQETEEKRKQRDEKQQKVQLQRELLEKQKREHTLQLQREREEKFRKQMMEKEEAKRLEILKKKQLKENQERKYAEEKAKKEEFVMPKEPQSASKENSLYIKMQKQIMMDKSTQKKKGLKTDTNAYCFDMLHTDDSTDDESKPSKKRPDPPQWSKKQYRMKHIQVQSFVNSNLLDTMFSAQPITVDLREIFPAIDARKLVRNSSAVWNTPPRYSQIPKH